MKFERKLNAGWMEESFLWPGRRIMVRRIIGKQAQDTIAGREMITTTIPEGSFV